MHTFKRNNEYNNKPIKCLFYDNYLEQIDTKKNRIKMLQDLQAPSLIIENNKKELDKMLKKIKSIDSYTPYLTYRDNIEKLNFLNTKVSDLQEEYNRNNRLVAYILNNEFYINLNTRYCPIISLYNK